MSENTSLALSEEQQLLRSTAKEFFAQNLPIGQFRRIRDEQGIVRVDAGLWQQMIELGWGNIIVPDALGGLNFGIKGSGLLCMEMGRQLSATHLLASNLATLMLLKSSVSEQLVLDMANGHCVCAVMLEIGDPVHDASRQFVAEGIAADFLLSLASDGALAVYELQQASRTAVSIMDYREYAKIETTSLNKMYSSKLAEQDTRVIQSLASTLTAAELLGIAEEVFERTLAHLNEREQFAQKIGAFQALQHRMAKLYCELQLSKSVVYDALHALESNRSDLRAAASHAKASANDIAKLASTEAIQMHGGMGITDELDIGLFYKRARVLQGQYGGTAYHTQLFEQLNCLEIS